MECKASWRRYGSARCGSAASRPGTETANASREVHGAVRPRRWRRYRCTAVRRKAAGQMGAAGRHRKQAGRRRHRCIQAYLGANDDHVLMFGPSGGFVVHPFTYKNLSYNQAALIPIARVSNTILAVAVKKDAPYNNLKEFTEAARAAPGTFNSGLVQGITELTFWAISTTKSCRSPRCRTATSIWPRSTLAKAASRS